MKFVRLVLIFTLCAAGVPGRAMGAHSMWTVELGRLTALLRMDAKPGRAESFSLRTLSAIASDQPLSLEQLRGIRLALAEVEFISTSDEARTLARKLLPLIKDEADAAASDLAEKMRHDLSSLLRQGLAATKPAQLAPILEQLGSTVLAADRSKSATPLLSRLHESAVLESATLEQLSKLLAEPDAERRFEKIHAVFRQDLDLSVVLPRSELLALVAEHYPLIEHDPNRLLKAGAALDFKIRQLLQEARDPENLAWVKNQVQALTTAPNSPPRAGGTQPNRYSWTLQALSELERGYQSFKEGKFIRLSLTDPAVLDRPPPPPNREQFALDDILEIEIALVGKVLPRVLHLSESESLRPGETSFTFLNRSFREATRKKDWDLVKRVLSLSNRWYFWGSIPNADFLGLRRFLLAGQRAGEGRLDQATCQYLFALQSGSSLVPVDNIARELAGLRRDHSAEFEAGAAQAIDAIFVQSLVWRFKPYTFATMLVPIDDQRESAFFQFGTRQMDLDVPAVPAPH